MTDRRDGLRVDRPDDQADFLRDFVAMELMLPAQPALLDRMLDQIERGRAR